MRALTRQTSLRGRHVIAAAAVVCFFLFFILRHSEPKGQLTAEAISLERYMNSGPSRYHVSPVKSTVDWGSIEYRYPPERPLTPLPKPGGKLLPKIQHQFGPEPSLRRVEREKRRDAVRNLTIHCWRAYRRYAWKRDALLPISGGGRDQFSGWAATLVDSLDTLWIMGLRDEFDEAVAAVAEIDFGRVSSSEHINIFETNIRYLGGLLAAYGLSKRGILLSKAIELGDLIYGGFNTPNRMPVDNIHFDSARSGVGLTVEGQVVSASPGTLSLELTHLSQLTGDPKYYSAISRVTELFYQGQNHTALPGLFPMYVSMASQDVTSGLTFTLGGCADSLYEYFPKMHTLISGAGDRYESLTVGFIEAAKKHLFFQPMIPDEHSVNILISGNVDVDSEGVPHLDPESEHLTCFIGATLALAGKVLNREEDVEIGARLARGCAYAYRAFPTGIMPERYNMVVCDDDANDRRCRWDEEKWIKETKKRREYKSYLPKGFTTAKDPRYILRPEAIESVFYLWRITGKDEWQESAWQMFTAVVNATTAEFGSASVKDVTVTKPVVENEDYMEVSSALSIAPLL